MKTLKYFLIPVFLCSCFIELSSQSVIRQSISCFGKSNKIEGGLISETVGQVYFTNTFKDKDTWLNPGFQQRMTSFLRKEDLRDELQLQLYPNPVVRELNIVSNEEIKNARIEIIDITGKVIFLSEQDLLSHAVLDMEHYTDGVYHIRIWDKTMRKSYHSRIFIIK